MSRAQVWPRSVCVGSFELFEELMRSCGPHMVGKINLTDIFDKNLNFLIGSGASFGLLPTLALSLKDETGAPQSVETLATRFADASEDIGRALLFMHYYKECIEPAMMFRLTDVQKNENQKTVIKNYQTFLETLLAVLQRKKDRKRCNIFTTNYDGCFVHVADEILKSGHVDFVINDGASGFQSRFIQAKNYNNYSYQSGVFERHQVEIPQINLIHLHGSVYWSKEGESIRVNYDFEVTQKRLLSNIESDDLVAFSAVLKDKTKTVLDLPLAVAELVTGEEEFEKFWANYKELPIVNPNKWKFYETVFEEQYYQMLRLLSYELEKPDTVFITFGFSFADEHILNLVKRSLSNPTLKLFVCCFDQVEHEKMKGHFERNRNVELIEIGKNLNFSAFNDEVFTLNDPPVSAEESAPEE